MLLLMGFALEPNKCWAYPLAKSNTRSKPYPDAKPFPHNLCLRRKAALQFPVISPFGVDPTQRRMLLTVVEAYGRQQPTVGQSNHGWPANSYTEINPMPSVKRWFGCTQLRRIRFTITAQERYTCTIG